MTETAVALHASEQWLEDGSRRNKAFRAAGRHSVLVRLLKLLMVAGSGLLIVGVVLVYLFDPFRKLGTITDFSLGSLGLHGGQVAMERPHLAGFRQDGRPYEMRARTMMQNFKKPNAFDLIGIEGVIGMGDKGSATVTASKGLYDNGGNALDLEGDVHVRSTQGYEAFLEVAHVDFKTSSVVTDRPVRAAMNTTTVTADSMMVSDNGRHLVFDGHVKSRLIPEKSAKSTAADLKGTAQ